MTRFTSIKELKEWLKESDLDIQDVEVTPMTESASITTTDKSATATITTTDNTTQTWVPDGDELTSSSASFIPECQVRDVKVEVKSLSEQPVYKLAPLSEGDDPYKDNVWYVDDFESVEGACSTSKIQYKDSTLLMNVCESDGVSRVTLILEVDGEIKRVPFRLEKSCQSSEDHDMIISL